MQLPLDTVDIVHKNSHALCNKTQPQSILAKNNWILKIYSLSFPFIDYRNVLTGDSNPLLFQTENSFTISTIWPYRNPNRHTILTSPQEYLKVILSEISIYRYKFLPYK